MAGNQLVGKDVVEVGDQHTPILTQSRQKARY
jgi:hypothetical protein